MEDRANVLRQMKVCRFCLSSSDALTNIHEAQKKDNKNSVPLPLQLMACVAIEVFANDGMPQLICKNCRHYAQQAYTFKTNCKKVDDALKLFLATGQLTKPFLKSIQPEDDDSQSLSVKEEKSSPKKKNDPQVITLNFSAEEQMQEEEQGDQGSSLEEDEYVESNINPVLKVNQVETDCFSCPHCDRSFPLKQLLDLHVVNHERERTYECEECGRKFFTKYDLGKHSQIHTGKKPYTCVVCQRAFSRESLLHRHEKVHSDVPKYLCTQCDKTFLTRQNLDSHMEKHKKRRPYTCGICNKSFVFKQGLERHELIHTEDKPHKCNYCEASFTSAIKLTRHITSHAGLRPYPCKLCGRTFLLSHHLTRHMRSHYAAAVPNSDAVIGQHKCDICSMSFRRKDSLINHSAIHSMVNLRCVICNTTFENAKMVKEHITTHLSGLPFPCEKCDYSFETKDQLEEHEVKHAEMEYEEQIEKEVVEEARQAAEEELEAEYGGDSEEMEEGEVTEFTLSNDFDNPELIRRTKPKSKVKTYVEFLKDDLEDDEIQKENTEEEEEDDAGPIKPIIRTEGTKVYTRKTAPEKPKIEPIVPEAIKTAPLEQITQSEISSIENLGLNAKKCVNVKVGDKTVKVKKFIVTKDEIRAMAKQGILEMKGGSVVLKNPGQNILNATLKPFVKKDLDLLESSRLLKGGQVKKYERKTATEESISSLDEFVGEAMEQDPTVLNEGSTSE